MSQALSRGWTGRIVIGSFLFAWVSITPTAIAATGQAPGSSGGQTVPSKVTFIDAPSSEKPAAREKRLKRECKGRPNAGMCLGHTR